MFYMYKDTATLIMDSPTLMFTEKKTLDNRCFAFSKAIQHQFLTKNRRKIDVYVQIIDFLLVQTFSIFKKNH